MTFEEDVDIKSASTELSEVQRQAFSTNSDLDDCALFMRVLDFLEEVFLALASGVGSEESVVAAAIQLLGAIGDNLKILDTLRSLLADSDILGRSQRVYDTADDRREGASRAETALMASHTYKQKEWTAQLTPADVLRQTCDGANGQ